MLTQSVHFSNDAKPTSDRNKSMIEKFALGLGSSRLCYLEFHGLCMVWHTGTCSCLFPRLNPDALTLMTNSLRKNFLPPFHSLLFEKINSAKSNAVSYSCADRVPL